MHASPELRDVRLYGHLGQRFGKRHRFAVDTPAEALRALSSQLPGFRSYLIEHSAPGYRVMVGEEVRTLQTLPAPMGREVIRIVPVVAGAGGDGLFGILLGAVLIGIGGPVGVLQGLAWEAGATAGLAASIGAGAASLGWGLALGGISSFLFKPAKVDQGLQNTPVEQRPSYVFSGAVNVAQQGTPVPVAYGRLRVGSVQISAGLFTEQIA